MTVSRPPRVLLAITFYNGRAFARRTMESAAHIARDGFEMDVLVLDDASPDPGFSALLADLSKEFGATYYRSPRNLGIPRNVNLGLATAQRLNYDYVIISNSDVIYAENSVSVLISVIQSSSRAASATAWSTNVDPYSLVNGAELHPESQLVADAVGTALYAEFGAETLTIPAGISFAMIIPRQVIDVVGLMDPIFGRGYGEESDWSARATSAGYEHVLAQGSYVFHAGRGSTLEAGVVTKRQTANWSNQRIVDHRSPTFRWNVEGFIRSGVMATAQMRAARALVQSAASRSGYAVVDPLRDRPDFDDDLVVVSLREAGDDECTAQWCGFTTEINADSTDVLRDINTFFGEAELRYTNIPASTWLDEAQHGYPSVL